MRCAVQVPDADIAACGARERAHPPDLRKLGALLLREPLSPDTGIRLAPHRVRSHAGRPRRYGGSLLHADLRCARERPARKEACALGLAALVLAAGRSGPQAVREQLHARARLHVHVRGSDLAPAASGRRTQDARLPRDAPGYGPASRGRRHRPSHTHPSCCVCRAGSGRSRDDLDPSRVRRGAHRRLRRHSPAVLLSPRIEPHTARLGEDGRARRGSPSNATPPIPLDSPIGCTASSAHPPQGLRGARTVPVRSERIGMECCCRPRPNGS